MATLYLYERRLESPAVPTGLAPGVHVMVWDASAMAAGIPRDWHPETEQRLRDGQTCVVGCHGNEVVAYCWLAASPVWVGEIARMVVPGPEDVYLYDAFTVPAWRGRGLFSALLDQSMVCAAALGRRRVLVLALARNRASRQAIARAGFERVATVSRLALWRLDHVWVRGHRSGRGRVALIVPAAASGRGDGHDRRGRPDAGG